MSGVLVLERRASRLGVEVIRAENGSSFDGSDILGLDASLSDLRTKGEDGSL